MCVSVTATRGFLKNINWFTTKTKNRKCTNVTPKSARKYSSRKYSSPCLQHTGTNAVKQCVVHSTISALQQNSKIINNNSSITSNGQLKNFIKQADNLTSQGENQQFKPEDHNIRRIYKPVTCNTSANRCLLTSCCRPEAVEAVPMFAEYQRIPCCPDVSAALSA